MISNCLQFVKSTPYGSWFYDLTCKSIAWNDGLVTVLQENDLWWATSMFMYVANVLFAAGKIFYNNDTHDKCDSMQTIANILCLLYILFRYT